ncbi:aminotransferase class I/II-fold pyridoxal phosphate-dependent enzyme [Bacillus sp. AK031]
MDNQNRMPLVEALRNHIGKNPVSFHVPGHKNGQLFGDEFKDLLRYDVTELTGLDDLHAPSEAIGEAQELLADYYGAAKSYFLVNGSTAGNLAMILGVCNEGDIVLVQRNCHKSILNGLKLANVQPVFLHPEFDQQSHTATGISQGTMEEALRKYPKAKAIILTYPTYYGMVYDLKSIIELAHRQGIAVLIDEAHGAHFAYGEPFPPSALELGADVVVQSAHKTLPAMTMGSYLHIKGDTVDSNKIEQYLGMLQSSSPSYPIMGSLDFARSYLASYTEEDIDFLLLNRSNFINSLKETGYEVIEGEDPLKLLIRLQGLSGFQLQERLEEQGVFTELADPDQVLFILPLLKKDEHFPFKKTIGKMSNIKGGESELTHYIAEQENKLTTLRYSFKEIEKKQKIWVSLDEAEGRHAGEVLIPYPPGIPLFYPGEEVTKERIAELKLLWEKGANFQGQHKLREGKISVLE